MARTRLYSLLLCHFFIDAYASIFPPLAAIVRMSPTLLGYYATIQSLASSFTQLFFGYLADRGSLHRYVLLGLAATAIATPTALVHAADIPHVDPEGAQAKALGYVHDAAAVDTAKFSNFAAGSNCANCQLYQGGDEWGGCGIFPGSAVNAKGWCSAWVKKA